MKEKMSALKEYGYKFSDLMVKGFFYAGWAFYGVCSLFLLYMLIFENQEKANIPLVLFVRNLPFFVLYVLFIWKNYRRFLTSRTNVKAAYLILSALMWLVWCAAMYLDVMYFDDKDTCQFLTYRIFL